MRIADVGWWRVLQRDGGYWGDWNWDHWWDRWGNPCSDSAWRRRPGGHRRDRHFKRWEWRRDLGRRRFDGRLAGAAVYRPDRPDHGTDRPCGAGSSRRRRWLWLWQRRRVGERRWLGERRIGERPEAAGVHPEGRQRLAGLAARHAHERAARADHRAERWWQRWWWNRRRYGSGRGWVLRAAHRYLPGARRRWRPQPQSMPPIYQAPPGPGGPPNPTPPVIVKSPPLVAIPFGAAPLPSLAPRRCLPSPPTAPFRR